MPTRSRKTKKTKEVEERLPKHTPWPFRPEDGPVSLAITHIDAVLEKIRTNKIRSFDVANVTSLRSLSNAEIKLVSARFQMTLETMKDALGGDPFCLESYEHFTKPQLKVAIEHLKNIRTLKHDDSSKSLRKATVRKKKDKPAAVVVSKVLYMSNKDPETGVEGISPVELVGAQQLWIYNTKTRKLGCYYAKNEAGLTAKGTTVLNYHLEKSTVKTLRKPKEQLWKFMTNGAKFWDAIRSVPQAIAPRLSRDTLLLKTA